MSISKWTNKQAHSRPVQIDVLTLNHNRPLSFGHSVQCPGKMYNFPHWLMELGCNALYTLHGHYTTTTIIISNAIW